MQLDIFDDSRDVMLRNDVVSALEHYDASTSRTALSVLAGDYPDDAHLADLEVLVRTLAERQSLPFPDHHAAAQTRDRLTSDVWPSLFGERRAAIWFGALWAELAHRAGALPFRADAADTHAAALFLLAGRWSEASDAVLRIESWRRIPAPLMWMAEARYRLGWLDGAEPVWPLLAELAWLSPERFDALLKRLDDPSLVMLCKAFDASFDGKGDLADLVWFPAWVLTEKPGLATLLRQCEPSRAGAPERALKLSAKGAITSW